MRTSWWQGGALGSFRATCTTPITSIYTPAHPNQLESTQCNCNSANNHMYSLDSRQGHDKEIVTYLMTGNDLWAQPWCTCVCKHARWQKRAWHTHIHAFKLIFSLISLIKVRMSLIAWMWVCHAVFCQSACVRTHDPADLGWHKLRQISSQRVKSCQGSWVVGMWVCHSKKLTLCLRACPQIVCVSVMPKALLSLSIHLMTSLCQHYYRGWWGTKKMSKLCMLVTLQQSMTAAQCNNTIEQ